MAPVKIAFSKGGLIAVSRVISSQMASVGFLPESRRNREWLDLFAPPPSVLVAAPVNLAMMEP